MARTTHHRYGFRWRELQCGETALFQRRLLVVYITFLWIEIIDLFTKQIPGFGKTLALVGKFLNVYETYVKEADVTLGPMHSGKAAF